MKKIISIGLAVLLTVTLISGCSNEKGGDTNGTSSGENINLEDLLSKEASDFIKASLAGEEYKPFEAPRPKQLSGSEPNIVNVKASGAKGNGEADDTAAIKKALTEAESKNGYLYFPAGQYVLNESITVSENVALAFAGKSTLVLGKNAVLTVNSKEIYAPVYAIFAGEGKVSFMPNIKAGYVEWFGDAKSGSTNAKSFENAINAFENIYLNTLNYNIEKTVKVPDGRNINIYGTGDKGTTLTVSAEIGFDYKAEGTVPTNLSFENITFKGTGHNVIVVNFIGTAAQPDSRLRIYHGHVENVKFLVNLEYTKNSFIGNLRITGSHYVVNAGKGVEDLYLIRNLGVSNDGFLIADGLTDGRLSKGLHIINTSSVWCDDIDMLIKNYEDVEIVQGGYDLGFQHTQKELNEAALKLENVSNFKIDGCWVASNGGLSKLVQGTTGEAKERIGIKLIDCKNGIVAGNSIVNHKTGVEITGFGEGTDAESNIEIYGNTFNGNWYSEVSATSTKFLEVNANFFLSASNSGYSTACLLASGNSDGTIKYNTCYIRSGSDVINTASGFAIKGNITK